MLLIIEDLNEKGGVEPQGFHCRDALHVEFFPGEVDDLDRGIDLCSMLLKALKIRGIIKKEVPKVVVQGCRALNGGSEGTKEVLEV